MRTLIAGILSLAMSAPASAYTMLQIGDSTSVVGYPNLLVTSLRTLRPDIWWVTMAHLGRPAGKHGTWDTPKDLRTALKANPTADCLIVIGINDRSYGDSPRKAASEVLELARICEDEFSRTAYVVTPFPSLDYRSRFVSDLSGEIIAQGRAQRIDVLDTSRVWWTRDWKTCGVTTCDGPGDGVHPWCADCRWDFAEEIAEWLP